LSAAPVSLREDLRTWKFACPRCEAALPAMASIETSLACPGCAALYERRDGILRLLPPERRAYFDRFLEEYTRIRMAEGRGSQLPSYYTQLPDCDASHPMAWQWRIRRCTVQAFDRHVAPFLAPASRIIDLGAGCGWFSNHLFRMGHLPCSIDLSVDDQDGLGAARHYPPEWPLVQSEFDHLPLERASADAVVYNASLHYSTDYARTLREALRVLRPGGRIVVLESPVYKHDESGRRMRAERHAQFQQRYGTRSESVPSIEYLTWGMLRSLATELGVDWQIIRPWYGLKWALRPWMARLRRRREPSLFAILVATRKESSG
jgi:SAM-dependent methyltransferase